MAGKGVFFYLWKSTALSEDSTQILKALYKLCPLLIPLYVVYIYYVYGNLRSHDPLLCCINLLFYSFPPLPWLQCWDSGREGWRNQRCYCWSGNHCNHHNRYGCCPVASAVQVDSFQNSSTWQISPFGIFFSFKEPSDEMTHISLLIFFYSEPWIILSIVLINLQ